MKPIDVFDDLSAKEFQDINNDYFTKNKRSRLI